MATSSDKTKVRVKLEMVPTPTSNVKGTCEIQAPSTLCDLRHFAWERFDLFWRCGGLLPHEPQVLHVQWEDGGRKEAFTEVNDDATYLSVLGSAGKWCKLRISGGASAARWELLCPSPKGALKDLNEYHLRAKALRDFAGLDREELQWMRELPTGPGSVAVNLVIAGSHNAGKSLLASTLLGRPDLFPASRFSFVQYPVQACYGREMSAELRRGDLRAAPVRTWNSELTLNDFISLSGSEKSLDCDDEKSLQSVPSDERDPANRQHTSNLTGFASSAGGSCGVVTGSRDNLVLMLPHPLLQAGLCVTEWPAGFNVSQGEKRNACSQAAMHVLIWCLDIHGHIETGCKDLHRVLSMLPQATVLVALTQCGECSGAERDLELARIREAKQRIQAQFPELSAERIIPVSAKDAISRAAEGEAPPRQWQTLVSTFSSIVGEGLRDRLTAGCGCIKGVLAVMEAACTQTPIGTCNLLNRLSPLIGVRASLYNAIDRLQKKICCRLEAAACCRRSAVLELVHVEDDVVLDPSEHWYAAHREAYLNEVRRTLEQDEAFMVCITEMVAEANLEVDTRLAKAAADLRQDCYSSSNVSLDVSAFTAAIDISHSVTFTNVSRSWQDFFKAMGAADFAQSLVVGTIGEKETEKPNKKEWLFERLEAEALSAISSGLESRKAAILRHAEAKYNEILHAYVGGQCKLRQSLLTECGQQWGPLPQTKSMTKLGGVQNACHD